MPMSRYVADVIAELERIAPLQWAEDWDNVGLLVATELEWLDRMLLTIDLTEAVLLEAQSLGANFIVAYHPIIFQGFKRLTRVTAGERIVQDALRSDMAIYSPHTALDAAPGGMNDWLAESVGPGSTTPIVARATAPEGVGMGRVVELDEPLPLNTLVPMIKKHLGLWQVRVAAAEHHLRGEPIRTAAVCAGAGGSIFERCNHVDLVLTGEMRHHDILARVARGTTVVLTDHSNCERGYLPHLATRLRNAFGEDVAVHVATKDRDPLNIV
jgi:dinuclear metal center YbgI/SA1388 family protein